MSHAYSVKQLEEIARGGAWRLFQKLYKGFYIVRNSVLQVTLVQNAFSL